MTAIYNETKENYFYKLEKTRTLKAANLFLFILIGSKAVVVYSLSSIIFIFKIYFLLYEVNNL
jgi:hypothetical protein